MKENVTAIKEKITGITFKDLFCLTPGAILVVSPDGRIVECNDGACEMFCYTKEEMVSMDARDIFPGNAIDNIRHMFEDELNTYIWMSLLKRDGRIFPVQCTHRVITKSGQKLALLNMIDVRRTSLVQPAYMTQQLSLHNEVYDVMVLTWRKAEDGYVLIGYDDIMEKYTDSKVKHFLGKNALEIYEDQPHFMECFNQCSEHSPIIVREMPYRMFSTGLHKYMRISFIFFRPDMMVTHFEDITNKKNAEQLLRDSERRRLQALEATSDAVWEWDIKTNQVILSSSYFSMLEYSPVEIKKTYPEQLYSFGELLTQIHHEDRDNFNKRIHEHIATNKSIFEAEIRMKTRSGGWKWILQRAKVVEWDQHGKPITMVGANIDIHDSKQIMDALEDREKRLSAVYMGIPVPTYTWQKKGEEFVLAEYNISAMAFSGGQISRFLGQKARDLYSENPQVSKLIKETFDRRTSYKKLINYTKFTTGERRDIDFYFVYVEPDMVLVHMSDITEKLISEERLNRSKENLQSLTEELFKAEENARKHLAQELHDSVGQHLSSIKYIAEKCNNKRCAGDTEELSSLSDKLVSVIQDTIDEVSRISMDLRPSTLDDLGILATISWYCREYHEIYPDIDLEIKIGIEERDVPPEGRIHLFRVIQESLNNVARHSKASKVQICLTKASGKAELIISDNGVGFNVHSLLTSGEAYRRGFGLLSMKERTKNSGGKLYIESVKGTGTTIRAVWPCR